MVDTVSDQTERPGEQETAEATALLREPRQDRSRRTLKRILEAGLYLLEHEGPDALTVTEITKRARTSVGSFYARFNGKDGLLRYMGERSLNEALEMWEQLHEGITADDDLRASLAEVVKRLGWLYLEDAGRSVVLLDGIEDPTPRRRRRLEDRIAEDLAELGRSPTRSDLATRVLTGVLQDATVRNLKRSLSGPETSPYPEVRVLLDELTELIVGYLSADIHERPGPPELPVPETSAPLAWEGPELPPPEASQEPPSSPAPATREIDTDSLIIAALAGSRPGSPVAPVTETEPEAESGAAEEQSEPGPEAQEPVQRPREARPVQETEAEEPRAPEPAPETTREPIPEKESSSESPPPSEPDPFDVWG
jgi:AcrR family transcriptional regulator